MLQPTTCPASWKVPIPALDELCEGDSWQPSDTDCGAKGVRHTVCAHPRRVLWSLAQLDYTQADLLGTLCSQMRKRSMASKLGPGQLATVVHALGSLDFFPGTFACHNIFPCFVPVKSLVMDMPHGDTPSIPPMVPPKWLCLSVVIYTATDWQELASSWGLLTQSISCSVRSEQKKRCC